MNYIIIFDLLYTKPKQPFAPKWHYIYYRSYTDMYVFVGHILDMPVCCAALAAMHVGCLIVRLIGRFESFKCCSRVEWRVRGTWCRSSTASAGRTLATQIACIA